MSLKIIFIATVLASLLSTGDFLKCLTCDGKNCQEKTCPSEMDRCLTGETSVKGKTVVHKSCATKMQCDTNTGLTKTCCDTDLCNGAESIGKSLLLLLVPVATIFMLS